MRRFSDLNVKAALKLPRRYQCYKRCMPMAAIVACLSLIVHAGCRPGGEAEAEQFREQLMSAEIPDSIKSIAEATRDLASDVVITVSGRIYANGMHPFDAQEASFNIIDLPKPGHNHEDPGDCPFCKRELENAASAIVQLVDSSGNLIPIPADQLLGLKKNQDVVVTGKVNRVGEVLIFAASSLHVLSEKDSNRLATEQTNRRNADS